VVLWAITGPIFHYSDTWQLVINTGTTIVTFLMVYLIQATQNRDRLALQIKLSELILALEGARNELAAVEKKSDAALETKVRVGLTTACSAHSGPQLDVFRDGNASASSAP
jgi:low affinity Fe/Cu permease